MKTTLTAQESATLISKGVSPERASEIFIDAGEHGKFSTPKATCMMLECAHDAKVISPIYNIADLLSLLPKTINAGHFYLDLSYGFGDWTASYILWDDCDEGTYIRDTQGEKTADELIDALYKLLLWAIDHNHVKLD